MTSLQSFTGLIGPPQWTSLDGERTEEGVKGPDGVLKHLHLWCTAPQDSLCLINVHGLWSLYRACKAPSDDVFPHCCPRQVVVLVVAVGDCGSLPAFGALLNPGAWLLLLLPLTVSVSTSILSTHPI